MTDKTNIIAQQNDDFRKSMGKPFLMGPRIPGKYVMSQGVSHMTPDKKIKILIKTREFDEFNGDNNPHGEHDMGRFQLEDNKTDILWKIDYYDINYEFLSNDPSDLSKTRRVLTTMLSCEY
ncbi:MAG: DUF3768 domain-containing protein [Bacteroidota bacterium]